MSAIIEVEQLRKVFSNGVVAVDGVSFSVDEGEIFGFLGPNGAGKSTTIAILTTLYRPTSGTVRVTGYDVRTHPTQARQQMGYVSQDLAVDDDLTGYGNMRMQAGLYHIPRAEVAGRMAEALRMVRLTERAGDLVAHYSGGMRKRLDIACGLIHRPRVLFLDEPTLGLDIQTRQEIWRYITELRRVNRMTIFLTTHYMEEADALCDRIAIIDRGRIMALDTPGNMKQALGGDTIALQFDAGTDTEIAQAVERLRALPGVTQVCPTEDPRAYLAVVTSGARMLPAVFAALARQPARIGSVSVTRPTLDDVFLQYTGRQLRDREDGGGGMRTRVMMRRLRG